MRSFCQTVLIMLLLLLLSGTVYADKNGLIQELAYQSKLEIRLEGSEPFFILNIGPAAAGKIRPDLGDLRIMSNDGELGYAQLSPQSNRERVNKQSVQLDLLNKGTAPNGKYSFVIVTRSIDGGILTVRLDKEPYLAKGTLYGSQDNRNWHNMRPITLFGIEGSYNEIPMSGMDYDYLKIELEQPSGETFSVKDAEWIRYANEEAKDYSEWIEADVTMSNQTKESQLVIDLKHQHRISSEWLLQTEEKGFYRQVITEGSHDKSQWRTIGTSFIFRGVADTDEMISYEYGLEKYRYIRIRIKNEDNVPLAIQSAKVKVHPVQVIVKAPAFDLEKSFPIIAYWGNPNLQSPSYDVKKLIDGLDLGKIPIFALAEHESNPNYEPTQPAVPLTERFPFLLPSVLILAIVVVAYLLFRNIKQLP